jgi:Rrf2 family transcriptional regulator, iron-sulfur cluster assembly transcription factor
MFKVNRRTDYAVRIMLSLGVSQGQLKAIELKELTGVPVAFVHKIVQELARSGLIWTTAGPDGGAALARPTTSITLLEIFEVMEGPIRLNLCLLGPELCDRMGSCPVHPIWQRLQAMIRDELEMTTLEMLVQRQETMVALNGGPSVN